MTIRKLIKKNENFSSIRIWRTYSIKLSSPIKEFHETVSRRVYQGYAFSPTKLPDKNHPGTYSTQIFAYKLLICLNYQIACHHAVGSRALLKRRNSINQRHTNKHLK